jgi:hypothetical protein
MRILIGTLLLGVAAAAAATITITPLSHDFGQAPLNGGPERTFTITMSPAALATDSMRAVLAGPDAADFEVDLTQPPGHLSQPGGAMSALILQSSCVRIWRTGTCQYLVRFRPKSLGPKFALLVVGIRPGYTANPATLKGVGVFGCRPNWVPCNYADNYSGTFEVHTRQVAPPHPSGT